MNTFKMQCVNYLLVNGWEDEGSYWRVYHTYVGGNSCWVTTETIGQALDTQLEWDDEGTN